MPTMIFLPPIRRPVLAGALALAAVIGFAATLSAAPAKAPAKAAAPTKPAVPLIASPADLKARIPTQLRITKPDYVVFVPQVTDDAVSDTGNEHFLVFDGPDGSLMAIWTQSTQEGQPDQHIVFARSQDEGVTWSQPRIIAGPAKAGQGQMASWAFPLVSKSGRLYVLYSQNLGKFDTFPHTTGRMDGIFSQDNGASWSQPQTIPMPRTSRDNPDASFPSNWICWQKPLRLTKDGRYYAGFTRWTSKAVKKNPTKSWISHDSVVEFMRFDNLDEDPEVARLKISWFAFDREAVTVPFPGHPEVSACQEPSIVKLPDGRLFCTVRTSAGSPFWTVSSDDGQTWSPARRLLRQDAANRSCIRCRHAPCTTSAAIPPAAAVMRSSSTITTATTRTTARPTQASIAARSTSSRDISRPVPINRCGSKSRSSSWTTTASAWASPALPAELILPSTPASRCARASRCSGIQTESSSCSAG